MSYILDALRKADAQRERDPARGIHAQPARPAMGEQAQPVRERPWFWAAGAAGVAAVAAAGWYLYRDAPATPQVAAVAVAPEVNASAVTASLEPVPAPPPAAAVLPPPVIVAPPVAPAPPAPPTRMERSVGSTPPMDGVGPRGARSAMAPSRAVVPAQATMLAPPAGSVASSVMAGASGPGLPAPGQAGTPPQAGSAVPQPHMPVPQQPPGVAPLPAPPPRAAPAPIPPAPPTPPVAGLPADAPKLVITGGVYSANKSQRMLIVNGQVVGEGADLGSGVSIEEIKPKTAVLRFRGGRYTVMY